MEERAPEPTDAREWARIERRQKLGVWLTVGVVALVAVAVGAAVFLGRAPEQSGKAAYEPIPGTPVATGTAAVATGAAGEPAGQAATGTAAGEAPDAAPVVPADCRIAYRRDSRIHVSKTDGTGEEAVFASAAGVFSLSPDGGTLAIVDSKSMTLTLVDVASGKSVKVGPAALDAPVWSRGSDWCAYTGTGSQAGVRRVSRDGSDAKALFQATGPAVSSDGAVIAGIRQLSDGSSAIVVYKGGKSGELKVPDRVIDVTVTPTRLYYSVAAASASAEIRSTGLDGSGTTVLRSGTQAGARVSFQNLCVSPDGKRLAYAETGDDGYSRIFSISAADGSNHVSLSVRRDDYPLCWGCDGRLFFVEGNAWQGEETTLMAVRADGTGRTVIRTGVTR